MDIMQVIKDHPVPIIGGVILLLILSRAGGSSSSSGGSGNAAAAYAAQSQITGINAQTSIALGAQSVEKAKIAADAATIRSSAAESFMASIAGMANSSMINESNNQVKNITNLYSNQQNLEKIKNDYDIGVKTINANISMNKDKLAAQQKAYETDANFKLASIGATTNGNLAMIGASKDAQLALNAQQNAFTASTLPTLMQQQQTMAKISGDYNLSMLQASGLNAQQLAQISGDSAAKLASINTQAQNTLAQSQKNKSDWGIVGNIFGSISDLFSW